MNKMILALTVASCFATSAVAGGYTKPMTESEPVVVKQSSSSNAGILIPILLLIGIAVAASNGGGNGGGSGSGV